MGRNRRYTEEARLPLLLLHRHVSLTFPQPLLQVRNCQSFAADFFGFIVGKKGVQPTVQVLRPLYTARPHLFLYDYRLYNNPDPEAEAEAEDAIAQLPGKCVKD